jgi:hypothetical protein
MLNKKSLHDSIVMQAFRVWGLGFIATTADRCFDAVLFLMQKSKKPDSPGFLL